MKSVVRLRRKDLTRSIGVSAMQYVLLTVVILFVIFTAYRDREDRLERAEVTRQHARERSELLTRITHPEVALVPVDDTRKVSTPDAEPEVDEFAMVGQVIGGYDDAPS